MDKQLAKKLLEVVNHPEWFDILKMYIQVRRKLLLNQLETEHDSDRVRSLQGALAELKRFETLRDEVIEKAK